MISVLDSVITPPEWRPVPFGRLVERRKEACRPDLPPLSVFLDEGVVPRASRQDNFNRLGSDLAKYLVVHPGDIVFNKLRTWQGGLGTSRYEGIVSPAYFVCRPVRGVVPKFLHYLLRSTTYLAELTRISKFMPPSQFDISWDDLRLVPILIPEVRTQRAIADYLDTETARIDTLISKKRHLIDLLAERRTALITQTVTRGLNPSPRLRPSNIDWRSDLPPRHRDQRRNQSPRTRNPSPPCRGLRVTTRLKRIATLQSECSSNDIRPYVALEHLESWTGKLIEGTELPMRMPASTGMATAEPGDVLFGKLRPYLAKSWVVNQPVLASTELVCMRPHSHLDARWLGYLASSVPFVEWTSATSDGAKMPRTNWEKMGLYELSLPSIAEQREIADYLDAETTRVDALSSRVEAVIKLLEEYRTALITAAVTGQVSVEA